jgi:prephenate dehydrogenase
MNLDLIIIATPVETIKNILLDLKSLNTKTTVIDITGVKSKVLDEVEQFSEVVKSYISCHPMAGREFTGPASSRADLFEGRAWLVSPSSKASEEHIKVAEEIGMELGSTVYRISAKEHDQMIATVSQMPQLISSLMATLLVNQNESDLNFAGQGLRDITRLADSDAKLWTHLIANNSENLIPLIEESKRKFDSLKIALEKNDLKSIGDFLENGNLGRAKIPGKHGAKARNYSYLPIVIEDKPGQLAKIIDECAKCDVNIEDLSIEHSPNQETGLVTIALSDSDAIKLKDHMQSNGWLAQEIRK